MMKNIVMAIAVLLLWLLLVVLINADDVSQKTPIYQYNESTNQEVLQTTQKVIENILIEETYKTNGGTYFKISSPLFGKETLENKNKTMVITENEYNEIIGKGNNAIQTDIYTLTITMPIVKYKTSKICPLKYEKTYTTQYAEKTVYKNNSARVKIQEDSKNKTKSAIGYIEIRRTAAFGEKDFTEHEIEEYKEKIMHMAKEYISAELTN